MTIGTDDLIVSYGTQDQVDSTAGTVANDAYSVAGDVSDWTNDDDAPGATFTWKGQFDTTMPTVGSIDLYCTLLNIQSTNDENDTDANYTPHYLGSFEIDFGVAADTDFYTTLYVPELPPGTQTSQIYRFFIKNDGTAQTIGTSWNLWVTPVTQGPHA